MENNELEEQLAELEKLQAQLETTEQKSEEDASEEDAETEEEATDEEAEEKSDEDVEVKADAAKDMFETAEEAVERASQLGCEGSHEHENGMFMPCATMEEYSKLSEAGEAEATERAPMEEPKQEGDSEISEKASRILENLTREAATRTQTESRKKIFANRIRIP